MSEYDVLELLTQIEDYKAQLAAAEEREKGLRELLERAKKTFEPFPVCSDLRSMTQWLREKHTEIEVKEIKRGFANHQRKFRHLYRDIEQALTPKHKEPKDGQ